MTAGIYCIENFTTGLFYVGCAIDLRARERKHRSELSKCKHHNRFLQRAWTKYGPNAFVFRTLEFVQNPSELLDREVYWIDRLRSAERKFGYNLCFRAASRRGLCNSSEHNRKIGNANRGLVRSAELRRRISATKAGVKSGPRPPEIVEKCASKQRGVKRKPLTTEHRAKISAALAGRVLTPGKPHSDDHKAAISRALIGKKRKPFSPEHRARIAEAARRQWEAIKATGHSGRSVALC